MDPVALAAGSALVGAMATDAWQQVHVATVALWRRMRPERADDVATELDAVRGRIVRARENADPDTEQQALAAIWRLRLQQLLDDDPAATDDIQRCLNEHLVRALPSDESTRVHSLVMKTEARDQARVYMAGQDIHFKTK